MRSSAAVAASALSLVFSLTARAAEPGPAAQDAGTPVVMPTVATPAAPLTRADVEAWLDGFMPNTLQNGDIAGAVAVVVKDGQILLQKGYGYADVEKHTPVDPARTLFRPASVSKLFTGTAVMQLVEQGKIDLDADINQYLDYKIPPRNGKPITMRNLMTHRAGFEEQARDLMGAEPDPAPDLGEFLKKHMPQRVFGPGETPAYSNYAVTTAGYIVARVSGMSFDDYLDKFVFAPLEMTHSTFRQPLPEALKADMSKGYLVGSKPPKPFEIVGPAPAGSLSASGEDMGHFMIAHLQDGRYGANQILKPETAQMMHTTALTFLPHLNRMLLGFYETNYNGHRVIAHAGDSNWFHSDLHLFIDDHVGIFVSVNSLGKEGAAGKLRDAFFKQFADRYLPGPSADGTVDAKTAAEHARLIAGRYNVSRRSQSSFLSLLSLVNQAQVVANADGTITLAPITNPAGVPYRWREIEPFVWRQVDGKELLAAKVENGRVTRASIDQVSPFMVFEPTPARVSSAWLVPAVCVGLAALFLTVLAWPTSALARRHYGATYRLTGRDAKAHRWMRYAAVAIVAVVLGWCTLIGFMFADFRLLGAKTDIWLILLQLVSPIVFIGGAAVSVWYAWGVVRGTRRWYTKLWAIVLALGSLTVLWVALNFHLIGFGLKY